MVSLTGDRAPVFAPNGVVATSQPLAASTGLAVLRRGGTAVDAAIATAVALTVVQPGFNDIGGDLFAIVWDGTALHGLNASGRAPAALRLDALAGHHTMPARGWLPVTVPGAPAGWRDLHQRFGRLPFPDLFIDAITYAERGYPVSPTVAAYWQRARNDIHAGLTGPEFVEWTRVFTPRGRAPRAGERFSNPDAAATLHRVAETHVESFYFGETAEAVAAYAARTGGLLTTDDFARHSSVWLEPVSVAYRDHEVWELPPPGQGIAALMALGILDGFEDTGDELWVHRQVEAMKLAFADAHAYITDPDYMRLPVPALLDPAYAAHRRSLISDIALDPISGDPMRRGGTVYLCAADIDGVMVSLIQSNYMGFGSHVVVPGTGFTLQNRGAGFSLDPTHPNYAAGRKRPFHTIIPAFLTRGGSPVGPFGVMGAHMQPQGHVQMVVNSVDRGLDPQAALGAPRWHWSQHRSLAIEPGVDPAIIDGLRQRGHEVTVAKDLILFGHGQAIWRLPDGGYVGGSDPRADGCAAGY